MKQPLVTFVIAALVLGHNAQAQHRLSVSVTNIKPGKGQLLVGLFNKESGFLKPGRQYLQKKIKVTGAAQQLTFENLPSGQYSIAVYQDENTNGTFDTNVLGIPTERFGFTNNVRPKLSAPTFSQTRISVQKDTRAEIKLLN